MRASRVPLLLLTGLAVLIAGSVSRVEACSCMSSGPACQAYWPAGAVFDATVLKIEPVDPEDVTRKGQIRRSDNLVTMEVRRSWKGVDSSVVQVVTSPYGASCGYDFKVGQRYLVFSRGQAAGGRWAVSLCSATREFDGTGDDADFLASLAQPETGGRVFGSIHTFERSLSQQGARTERVPIDLDVRISGNGRTQTVTSQSGRYQFTRLAPGRYDLSFSIPNGYSAWRNMESVELPNARACAEVNLGVNPAGRILGRLVDKAWRGVPRVDVEVTDADQNLDGQRYLQRMSAVSDGDGHFVIENVPPGRYIFGINLEDLPSQFRPYARTIYPGGNEPPMPLEVALGQSVDLGSWQIPPPLPVVKMTGIVRWKDGAPAAGVWIHLWDVTREPRGRPRGAGGGQSGPDGRFVIEAREGRRYELRARQGGAGPALPLGAPLIEARSGMGSLHLVIQRNPPK